MGKIKVTIDGLTDDNGTAVDVGDLVEVTFPEISIEKESWVYDNDGNKYDEGGDCFYSAECKVLAEIKIWLSRGLVLKIIDILTPPEDLSDSGIELSIGSYTKFKYTKWQWVKSKYKSIDEVDVRWVEPESKNKTYTCEICEQVSGNIFWCDNDDCENGIPF